MPDSNSQPCSKLHVCNKNNNTRPLIQLHQIKSKPIFTWNPIIHGESGCHRGRQTLIQRFEFESTTNMNALNSFCWRRVKSRESNSNASKMNRILFIYTLSDIKLLQLLLYNRLVNTNENIIKCRYQVDYGSAGVQPSTC